MRRFIVLLGSLLVLAMAGCQQSAEPDPTPTAIPATPMPSATPRPTATPTALPPTPTPTATPLPEPALTVPDQTIEDAGTVQVDGVTALADGWLVVTDDNGQVLTQQALAAGTTTDVTLTIDPLAATEMMRVLLVSEEAFDDGDVVVSAEFSATIDVTYPSLAVSDQTVAENGILTVGSAFLPSDGWVVIYNDDGGEPSERIGQSFLKAGDSAAVPVVIPWRDATPTLHAILHFDKGVLERFDGLDSAENEASDPAILVQGQPVEVVFSATFLPEVYLFDQPIVNSQIVVERVISYGPGWIAVVRQNEETEQPSTIIGSAPLADGVNEQVAITVDPTFATPTMYVALYEDTQDIGQFEYPNADPIIQYSGAPYYIPFQSSVGNYLIGRDQAIGADNALTVDYTISDIRMWVVARGDDDGEPGDVIGQVLVPPGINRQVQIDIINEAALTETVHIVLHIDNGESGVFEFPDGLDFELQRNRNIISVTIRVLSE